MGRKRGFIPLDVFSNRRRIGQLVREASGAVSFAYDSDWLAWEHHVPVSLSLPMREDRYIGQPVLAVFENLLPDNDDIRRRVAERSGAEGIDAFSLLSTIGRDCVGSLQFLPEGQVPDDPFVLTGVPLNEEQIEALLNDLRQAPLGIRRENDFRISIAGAQEKTALLLKGGQWIAPTGTTPTTHILKPQIGTLSNGIDLSHSVENEHYCLTLMHAFGLPTANHAIETFGDTKALVIERFDRHWAKDGRLLRLPQEDFCQALSVPPTRKYQSDGGPGIADILRFLTRSDEPRRDQANFFKATVLFWLIGATDGHAKNFSLGLTTGEHFTMTPLYDVLTVQPSLDAGQIQQKEMRLAMRAGKNRHYRVHEIFGRHYAETAIDGGLSKPVAEAVFDEIRAQVPKALDRTMAAMPKDFPPAIHESVSAGITARIQRLTTKSDE